MARNAKDSEAIKAIKASVRARDNYCCTKCGMSNNEHLAHHERQLEVHRIVPGSVYTVNECVTLCQECHKAQPKRPRGTRDLSQPTFARIEIQAAPGWTEQVDATAARLGLSRSAFIRLACNKLIQAEGGDRAAERESA